MKISATRTIGDISGSMIIRQIVTYCEMNYDVIRTYPVSGEGVTTQKSAIVDGINQWLKSQKHITDNGLIVLNNLISWEDCVTTVWASIKASIEHKTNIIPGN